MQIKTRCIVLRTVKYSDDRILVDLLTKEEGRLTVGCRISTAKSAKVRRQHFQPMTILDAVIERSPRKPVCNIRETHVAMPYSTVNADAAKLSIAFFVAEFLTFATRDQRSDATLYDFVERCMVWLDTSNRGIANFHLMLMMRISMFLGFQPDMRTYRKGTLFDLREGVFTSVKPTHNDFLMPDEAEKMQVMMRMTASNLHLFLLSRNERNRIIDIILMYYRLHIPQFGELKTLDVLRVL